MAAVPNILVHSVLSLTATYNKQLLHKLSFCCTTMPKHINETSYNFDGKGVTSSFKSKYCLLILALKHPI